MKHTVDEYFDYSEPLNPNHERLVDAFEVTDLEPPGPDTHSLTCNTLWLKTLEERQENPFWNKNLAYIDFPHETAYICMEEVLA